MAKTPPILAPNGNLARHEIRAESGIYATPSNQGRGNKFRPRTYRTSRSNREPVSPPEWRDMLQFSRGLFAQEGDLGGAIIAKASYTVGEWIPKHTGSNTKWGQEAAEFLTEQFYPLGDLRGDAYDFPTAMWVDAVATDVDGDSLCVLTETGDHFPAYKMYSASDVGSGTSDGEITEGRFKGAKVQNGVIFGTRRSKRPLGYRLLGDESGSWTDISARDCQMIFEPQWQAQGRGVPPMGRSILSLLHRQDINGFILEGIKRANSVGLIIKNQDGAAETSESRFDDNYTSGAQDDIYTETINGVLDYYYKAGADEGLEFANDSRPSPNTTEFLRYLVLCALYALSWPAQLMDPSQIGGASVRIIQDQARNAIRRRQRTVKKRSLRIIRYALAKAMKHGRISRNDDDWWKWEFQAPPRLTVDQGHDHKIDKENLLLGTVSETEYCAKLGSDRRTVRDTIDEELTDKIDRAERIAADTGKDFDWVFERLHQRSPNLVTNDSGDTNKPDSQE